MPRVKKKPGPKPGSLDRVPGVPFGEGNAGPEDLKARKAARLAELKQRAIDAAGPLYPIPTEGRSLLEDMLRAWRCPPHPLDGPGVEELRRIVKDDFPQFMKMYRAEQKQVAAEAKEAGEVDTAAKDVGTEAALALIDQLLGG